MGNPTEPFTLDPHATLDADERTQLLAFLDTHRRLLNQCLDGLTEEEARRRLVPSRTTLLGLVKHATYVERVWFTEAVTGTPRQQLGLPPKVEDSFVLAETDTIVSIRDAHREACRDSARVLAGLALDDVATGHRFGAMTVRWILLHLLRELAQHCGHADILREQIVAARRS
ncbi:DinB family protein [Micromonospora yangpuensis]|uniref:DinB superfamily protein n=1 Tax=Micromonospora yangpuensis TaxID=683228 RepID=A0A1C6V5N4_9ACTN|nr:DinB family protein [Micromonospora yangpuensis]GGM18698.1 hypothetical protein GCM10012279_41270 [Micromonospora yangpuensis]SCL61679.1 Protein of unknown function [Micromonospora yangpuensis]